MSQIFTTEIPVPNLLGVEKAGLVTESRSIPRQGVLAAGTLLQADGTKSVAGDESPHAVLAFPVDTGTTGTGAMPVTVYLAGSFLRSTVERASGFTLTADQIAALRDKGIFFERSVG